MSKLAPEQFQRYCREHNLAAETIDLLARIRFSQPVRRVQGRAGNVRGLYPSKKMGVMMQFESQSVELSAMYLMDHDEKVIEFYEQPHTFKLRYLDKTGKRMQGHYYTPDFLVLRPDGVAFEEWKTEEELYRLCQRQPYRYQRGEDGTWHCPPAEALAHSLGVSFRVCSSAILPPTYIDNLDFLADYFVSPPPIPERIISFIRKRIQESPGMSMATLLGEGEGLRANDIYALIAQGQLFVDLDWVSLRDHYRTRLFPDQHTAQALAYLDPSGRLSKGRGESLSFSSLSTNTRLLWDGCIWTLVNLGETTTTLLPERGEPIQLPSAFFLRLLEAQIVIVPDKGAKVEENREVAERMAAASRADLRIANERFRLVSAYLEQDREQVHQASVTERTIRRWVSAYHSAQASWGRGYVGLLPQTSRRGNREPKAPEDSRTLLTTFITEHYETPREAPAWEVYLAYQRECEARHIPALSSRTFYRYLNQRAGYEQTKARRGAKAAYSEEPWHWELTQATPRHGNRPFAVVHMDHTELDVMLVSSVTGKPLGKPWATFLVDAYSRRLLAVYLTFDPPSYRSCMMALRICVKRFERMPHCLVVDGGKEFQREYFDALVAHYHTLKKTRPGAKPRFGSVIERLFGTTNTEFVYNLLGNTQAAKRPRQLTKEVDPKRQAVWTLGDLYDFLCEWAYDVYDQMDHPALFQSPREAFAQGLVKFGEREHRAIAYADKFLMMSSPSTRKGTAKVERGRGVKIHGIYYSALPLRSSEIEGTQVEVRYDPFDIGTAYAYVGHKWVRCISQYHTILQGHTEKEVLLASKEIRRQTQLHEKRRTVTAKRLADFLANAAEHEAIRHQRIRDLEARAILDAIAQPDLEEVTASNGSEPISVDLPLSDLPPVDFARLSAFEEYH